MKKYLYQCCRGGNIWVCSFWVAAILGKQLLFLTPLVPLFTHGQIVRGQWYTSHSTENLHLKKISAIQNTKGGIWRHPLVAICRGAKQINLKKKTQLFQLRHCDVMDSTSRGRLIKFSKKRASINFIKSNFQIISNQIYKILAGRGHLN